GGRHAASITRPADTSRRRALRKRLAAVTPLPSGIRSSSPRRRVSRIGLVMSQATPTGGVKTSGWAARWGDSRRPPFTRHERRPAHDAGAPTLAIVVPP